MSDREKLSPTQRDFLKYLFTSAAGNMKEAAKSATGSEDYSLLISDDLLAAIKKRADTELMLSAPKAIFIMQKMLNEPESVLSMDKIHKVCADILDRAGLARQERASTSTMTVGIVMLPNKDALPTPPTIEMEAKLDKPVLLTAPIRP